MSDKIIDDPFTRDELLRIMGALYKCAYKEDELSHDPDITVIDIRQYHSRECKRYRELYSKVQSKL